VVARLHLVPRNGALGYWEVGVVCGETNLQRSRRVVWAPVVVRITGVSITSGATRARVTAVARDQSIARALDRANVSTSFLITLTARTVDIVALTLAAVIAQLGLGLGLMFVAFSTVAVWSTGMRSGRLAPRVSDEIPYLIRYMALATVALALIAEPRIELGEAIGLGLLAIALVALARAVEYDVLRRLRVRGIALEPVVVIGAGPTAVALVGAMEDHPEYGLIPLGFVDHNKPSQLPLPYLGQVKDLSDIMSRFGARYAMFAFGAVREHEMISTIRRCDPRLYFYVLFRFFELGVDSGPPSVRANLAGFPVRRIHPPAAGNPNLWMKRLVDMVAASLGLVVLAPVMAVCAILVRLSSPGPILFRQPRVGRDGAVFEILKFRTMQVNSDSDTTWTVETDSRVTPIGRFLRASHLDELPQFVNVLRGEMSLVGPRPERPFFVDQFDEQVNGYRDRHRVRSGITGWSQVNGLVGDSSIEDRARNDNWYIEHWTLWADIVIVLRTVRTTFMRQR
jgi:exopolysaccharide biosynthesis polyprenyl glycosylphosphotransferase